MVRFVCFYLRIVADEERRVDEYIAQKDQAVSVDSASDKDASTESEYNNSDIEGTVNSNNNNSVVLQQQPRQVV